MKVVSPIALSRHRYLAALLLILLLAFGLRVYELEADAPTDVSPTQELVVDGPATITGGRNRALFGVWEPAPSPLKAHKYYPFMNWLAYAFFSMLGVGLWQANFISVVTGILTVALVAAFAREHFGRRASLLGALFVAVNYVFITYNRDPMAYTTVSFAMVLSLYLWGRGKAHPGWYAAAGAVSVFGALFIKLPVIAFVPAGLLGLFVLIWRRRERRLQPRSFRSLLLFGAVGGLVLGLWYFFYYRPQAAVVSQGYYARTFNLAYGLEENLRFAVQSVLQLGVDFGFVMRMLPLFALAYGYAFYRAMQYFSRQRPQLPAAEIVALAFLASTTVMLWFTAIRPLRFQILLIPLLAVVAGRALDVWLRSERLSLPTSFGRLYPLLVYGGSVYFFYQVLAALLMLYRVARADAGPLSGEVALSVLMQYIVLVVALGLGMVSTLLFLWWATREPERPLLLPARSWRWGIAIAILLLAAGGQLLQYGIWARAPQYSVVDASRRLGEVLDPATTTLGGSYAPTLAMENELPVVWFYGDTDGTTLVSTPFTHVAVETVSPVAEAYTNDARLRDNVPELMRKMKVVHTYRVRDYLVTIYER